MSINFHAYQSRGYLFENYEAQCEQWRSIFSGYDPVRTAKILYLQYDEEYLYLQYYQKEYRLSLRHGILYKKETNEWTDKLFFNESMSIYHLLYYVKDCPKKSGNWVQNEHLDTRRKSSAINDILLKSFSEKFSGKCDLLKIACEILQGVPAGKGDVAYEIEVFPQIKIRLCFWDADEEFPAQTQIFVDSKITDYVHLETTGCMVSDLLERLEEILTKL